MKIFLKYLFCLLTGALLFSCQKDNPQGKLLTQAQDKLVNNKPEIALNVLASIQDPEQMNNESYMQYIVISVGAKYETKADITKDTLIFETQRYFNKKEDLKYTVLSNYYTAQLYDESGNFPKALESYMLTVSAADKSNNDLLAGKSYNNIGYIYYKQDLFDSAISNFKKALLYYAKVENSDERFLKTLTNIGRAYEVSNKLDSAYFYFDKCLSLAKETQNKEYQFYSLKNLGVTCNDEGEYDKAIAYFQLALSMNISEEVDQLETPKIHLYLLNIYNKKGNLKLAKQYSELVTASLGKVASKSTTVIEMYAALGDYYQLTGGYKQALEYRNLEIATQGQIKQQKDAPALLEADKNFYLVQKDREILELRSDVVFFLIIGAIVFGILLTFALFVWRNHKKNQAEIKFYAEKYDELREVLYAHINEYPKIEAEIKSMLEDD